MDNTGLTHDEEESRRLDTLRRYDILDTPPDARFDNITALAAELVQTPIALISLVDADRIWFKSVHGLDVREVPRDDGLCSTAIEQDAPHVLEDTFSSPRTRNHPLVNADPAIRFYAGVPLKADDGRMLGVLCVMDFKPRTLPAAVLRQLQSLARLAADQLELVRALARVDALARSDRRFRLLFENIADPMLLLDPESGMFIDWNPAAMAMLHYPGRDEITALTPADISPPTQPDGRDSAGKAIEMMDIALREGSHRFEWAICSPYREALVIEVLLTSLNMDGRQVFITTWRDLTQQKQAEHELRDSEIRWKFAIEGSGDGLWDWNIPDSTVFFSRRWKEMLGFEEDEIGNDLSEWSSRVHPDDLPQVMLDVSAHLRGETAAYINEHRVRCRDGSYKWILDRGRIVGMDASGQPLRMVGTHTDITDRRRVLMDLETAEFGHRALLNAMADGVFITQPYRFVFANPALPRMLGYELDEFIGLGFDQVVHPDFIDLWTERFRQRISSTEVEPVRQYEVKVLRKGGQDSIWIELIASRFMYQGAPAVLGIVRNVSEKKKAEEIIWRQANYDALTQLPNRLMLLDRLDQEIRKSRRSGLPLAVLFIDLDRFKEINDTLGHHLGDKLLQKAAQRLSNCLRETDLVARLGGDEFTVVVTDLDNRDGVERVAQHILDALQRPFELDDEVVYVTASVGITLYPHDAHCIEDLLKQADQAMYDAKHLGRNRLSYFTPSMQARAEKRMRLVGDMHEAIDRNQFYLVFQPIVDLVTGRTLKAEALIRWNHPEKGVISPADFIPIAEETGLIVPLGDWVARTALAFALYLQERLGEPVQISVNQSPVQFRNRKPQHLSLAELVRHAGAPGGLIAIEITEGTLLDADAQVLERLVEMRNAGMQISLDDFGTGYSSLSYLNKFDIDYLKIDRSFVQGLAPQSSELALCEAMIVMAHKLGIAVIAEGVETAVQRDLLITAGCDYAQGYFFARPLSPEHFEAFVRAGAPTSEG
jgi:diguanylate cyclase (GGDEF)-like protein/PAS domain S-box-containing protein